MLKTALQALNLADLYLDLPAQVLILGCEVLEVCRALIRILWRGTAWCERREGHQAHPQIENQLKQMDTSEPSREKT